MAGERARVKGGGFTSAAGSVGGVVANQRLSPAVQALRGAWEWRPLLPGALRLQGQV